MKKIYAVVLVVLMLVTSGIWAQEAESAGELVSRLYSPSFISYGASILDQSSSQSTALNPAAAASFQRVAFDFNALSLQNNNVKGVEGGLAINSGFSFPSKIGVFSGNIHYANLGVYSETIMDFGDLLTFDFSFSKELYSNLYVGLGTRFNFGTPAGATEMDWGAGLNLGFIHNAGNVGRLKNLVWGFVLSNLGKPYGLEVFDIDKSIPESFTPAVGMQFDLVDSEKVNLSVNGQISSPTFTDLKLDLGTRIKIGRSFQMGSSMSADLRDAISGYYGSLIPSLGLTFQFFPEEGQFAEAERANKTEVKAYGGGGTLNGGLFAVGAGFTIPFGIVDKEAPTIEVDYSDTLYISPNYDGIQDEINIPYTADDGRYIMKYQFLVKNEEGEIVKTFKNKDERPENESLSNLFSRFISEKQSVTLPEVFRWDGKGDNGDDSPDGEYSFTLEFSDDNGNTSEAGPFLFVIDNTAPELSMEKSEGLDLLFSPDGDGNKDSFEIKQSGSVEGKWEASLFDINGNPVKTLSWEKSKPESFVWDGTDDQGLVVPDGVYRYVITSTDPAGNSITDKMENILVNTEQPPVGLTISRAFISPGTESSRNTIDFELDVPVTAGIASWTLDLINGNGNAVRTYSSREYDDVVIPDTIKFDGRGGDNSFISEGKYASRLSVIYQNGHQPVAESPWFICDTTAPSASVVAQYDLISPDGDGNKDTIRLDLESSQEREWMGYFINESDEKVKSFSWLENVASTIIWDGRDEEGLPVDDGNYRFILESEDEAGNKGASIPVAFVIDTSETTISLSAAQNAFSPNNDRVKDTLDLYPKVDDSSPVESWQMDVLDAEGNSVYSWSGNGAPKNTYKWDGKNSEGKVVPDGTYSSRLSVTYVKGDIPESRSNAFVVDTVAPELKTDSDYVLFSPEGDGLKDDIIIRQNASAEDSLKGVLTAADGTIIRNYQWQGTLEDVVWDGTDKQGNPVDDGEYRYVLSSRDEAGNEAEAVLAGIVINRTPTPLYLTVKQDEISPDNPEKGMQEINIISPADSYISQWNLDIRNDKGATVYSKSGKGKIPARFTWNGIGSNGRAAEGILKAYAVVEYEKGNKPEAVSRSFRVDASAPLVSINMTPQPFSPDDDNVDDELTMAIGVQDLSPISNWSMRINDPKGNDFISFSGLGKPSERIIWDGRSSSGELVQAAEDYPYTLSVSDSLGNTAVEKGLIPVDVLVIREGDLLKIRISNINFEPNSAVLQTSGDQGEKNEKILARVAELLSKYSSYNIIVEGHAVSVFWDNKAKAEKEQKEELLPLSTARADAVREKLEKLGIGSFRMESRGVGGSKPIVSHGDLENRWKNRRVEFILVK